MRIVLLSAAFLLLLVCNMKPVHAQDSGPTAEDAKAFLAEYFEAVRTLERASALAEWKAANSGEKDDFDASAVASLALRKYHSDPEAYGRLTNLLTVKEGLSRPEIRSLEMAERAYRENQLPPELLKSMVELSNEIEMSFNTFRAEVNGRERSNNDLLEMLADETDSEKRRQIWDALKQVGAVVAPKLVELAKLRNTAAERLGYENYWVMSVRLQRYEPEQLLGIFEELEQLTREPFAKMKAQLDGELAERFGVEPEGMMPWSYDNPFFQAAPPSAAVDLDEFYEDKTKEEIVEIARAFLAEIGLPADEIIERSDLYEREGKDQHAFCISINRGDDVRTLCNVKPTAEWMDTMLHELGHAVYDTGISRRIPYNLREPAHIFTTEGIAMLLGALGKNPAWMKAYADADADRVDQLAEAILQQRRREQLIFARWTLVMLHSEKAFYENPECDMNTLWWDNVERYQLVTRPPDRDLPDWAAKPHFTIAPVYYHNYMLGELFAAQLRHTLAKQVGHEGPTAELSFNGRTEFGQFLKERVFHPGAAIPWPAFVRRATGEPLTARHFAAEVQ